METNTFKLMVNDDLTSMVEIYERILSRDTEGAVRNVEYDIWYHGERLHCGVEDCGEAFTLAAEIVLEETNK